MKKILYCLLEVHQDYLISNKPYVNLILQILKAKNYKGNLKIQNWDLIKLYHQIMVKTKL